MKSVISAILLLAVAWIAWPYWAAYDLVRAVQAGDVQKMEESVDWASVRAGFRQDVAGLLTGLGGDKDGKPSAAQSIGGALAALAGGSVIDKALEAVVNPRTLAMLVRKHATETASPPVAVREPGNAGNGGSDTAQTGDRGGEIDFGNVRYAFFTGPTTFEVDVASEPGQAPLGLIFRFDGGWRLSRVELPLDELRQVISGASPQMGKRLGLPGN